MSSPVYSTVEKSQSETHRVEKSQANVDKDLRRGEGTPPASHDVVTSANYTQYTLEKSQTETHTVEIAKPMLTRI